VTRDVTDTSQIPQRRCEWCGESLEERRPNVKFCNAAHRMEAFKRRRLTAEIREGQEEGVADVERQLADGRERILVAGRLINREPAWAAAAGLRATWAIEGARATARTVFEGGQWWVLVQVPLGRFPG